MQRRRSSVGVGFSKHTSFSSSGYDNSGYEEDSALDDDEFTEFSGSGNGRNSVQFEVTSRV